MTDTATTSEAEAENIRVIREFYRKYHYYKELTAKELRDRGFGSNEYDYACKMMQAYVPASWKLMDVIGELLAANAALETAAADAERERERLRAALERILAVQVTPDIMQFGSAGASIIAGVFHDIAARALAASDGAGTAEGSGTP